MVERIGELPEGVLGFRVSGKLGRDEYHDALMRPIYDALEAGEELRLLVELPDEFDGLDAGALWEDLKAAGAVGLEHRSAWKRFALVTDKDWVRHGVAVFGWVSPGELRVFESGEREQAAAWVAA
ncbi:MAG TPA: STAS/SEC14 domain-containing protein [Gaiella sp.]|jgi:stage II sporulation SpoAA-like protein